MEINWSPYLSLGFIWGFQENPLAVDSKELKPFLILGLFQGLKGKYIESRLASTEIVS
jgi:hypothetical protein